MTLQAPQRLKLPKNGKRDMRAQFGALCYRTRKGKLEILLITGRKSGRWGIPKGWPVHRATGPDSALREAWEEAGVKGTLTGDCLGVYIHYPQKSTIRDPRMVAVYPVRVKKIAGDFPERGQRKSKWLTVKKAMRKLDNPGLAQLIQGFKPPEQPKRPF